MDTSLLEKLYDALKQRAAKNYAFSSSKEDIIVAKTLEEFADVIKEVLDEENVIEIRL